MVPRRYLSRVAPQISIRRCQVDAALASAGIFDMSSAILTLGRCALAIAWVLCLVLVIRGFSNSPVRLDRQMVKSLIAVSPQGWGFFTRNPRERQYRVYEKSDSSWVRFLQTNAHRNHLFGIRRTGSAQGMELGRLLRSAPGDSWVHGRVRFDEAPSRDEVPAVPIQNVIQRPTMCGEFMIVHQEPVPWAWSKSRHRLAIPASFLRVTSNCTNSRS